MANGDTPSLSEIQRRLQRVEDRMEERLVLSDVYNAEKSALIIQLLSIEKRLETVERAQSTAVRLLVTTLIGVVVQAVFLLFTVAGRT